MAWLYKHPRSQFWQIGWRVGKKLFNRSTSVSERTEAEKQLALFNLMADARRENRLTEDFYNSLSGRELDRISMKDGADKFLGKCKGTTAPGTYTRYVTVLDALAEYVHASESAPLLGDIDGEVAQGFLNAMRERTSATTSNFYRRVLNAFFAHALENKKIRANPISAIQSFKASKTETEIYRRPFEEDEIRKAYAAAPAGFWKFAIVFGLYTGLRLGNIATLRWQDVDLKNQIVNVVDIKSPDRLKIPIVSPFLLNLLADLRRAGKVRIEDFVFPEYAEKYISKVQGGENKAAGLSREFRGILVNAGLTEKYVRNKESQGRSCRRAVNPLSFHSLRHNFVTMLKDRGASQSVARELVGHDSDAVNQLYTHTSETVIRKSLKKLPEVFK